MTTLTHEQIIHLLHKLNSTSYVETFRNFPEVVRAGKIHLNREDVDYLFSEGYLEEKRVDSFGQLWQLSERAKLLLNSGVEEMMLEA
jgi:propanediol utilization protein